MAITLMPISLFVGILKPPFLERLFINFGAWLLGFLWGFVYLAIRTLSQELTLSVEVSGALIQRSTGYYNALLAC